MSLGHVGNILGVSIVHGSSSSSLNLHQMAEKVAQFLNTPISSPRQFCVLGFLQLKHGMTLVECCFPSCHQESVRISIPGSEQMSI